MKMDTYRYIQPDDYEMMNELEVQCSDCGEVYILPLEDWEEIVHENQVQCECGHQIMVDVVAMKPI